MEHDNEPVNPDEWYDPEAPLDDVPEHKLDAYEAQRQAERKPKVAAMRVPPHNTAAEQSLLGCLLLSRRAIDDTIGTIAPADFYTPSHGHIYEAILGLHVRAQPVDPVTVGEALQRAGLLDAVGGPATLVSLQANTPATSNAARYAQVVADHAAMRHLIRAGGNIAELGWAMPDNLATALDKARDLIENIADPDPTGAIALADLIDDYRATLEHRIEHGDTGGILSGLADLDALTGGFRPGQLVTICGRTSMGKTAVAGVFALNADAAGHATLVASIEMGTEELEDRWLSTVSRVHTDKIRTGDIPPRDLELVEAGLTQLERSRIHILDEPAATVATIRSAARKVPNLALIVIDYLQLLTPVSKRDNRQVEVSEISAALKRLARDLNVPVLALAQLNRGVEQRVDKRPMLSDLRESGAIEQDSDIVLGLFREEYYKPDTERKGVLEIIVLKQRSGALGTAEVAYRPATGEILNLGTA